ncbi:MAG: hypothetical protein H7836_04660 [Magnetococcus sp. YQC-3]
MEKEMEMILKLVDEIKIISNIEKNQKLISIKIESISCDLCISKSKTILVHPSVTHIKNVFDISDLPSTAPLNKIILALEEYLIGIL